MANREKFTVEQVAAALEAGAGIYTAAADKLGCAPNTIKNYVQRYKRLQLVEKRIRETVIDSAEAALLKMISDPKHSGHTAAVIFYLKTKGRDRGYVERGEHQLMSGGTVNVYLPKEDPE